MTKLNDLYTNYGQSPWIDNLRRDWLNDGTLVRYLDDGVRGLTSNPSIFAKTISGSAAYDDDIANSKDTNPEKVFERRSVGQLRAGRLGGRSVFCPDRVRAAGVCA